MLINEMEFSTVNTAYQRINSLIANNSSGFMYQETISKVKNYE